MYEISGLSVRSAIDAYKTVSHPYQIICAKSTSLKEIENSSFLTLAPVFLPLNIVETLPLNSIIGNEKYFIELVFSCVSFII